MTVAISNRGYGYLTIDITGVASTAAGGIGEIKNPEGVDVTIIQAWLECITEATAAATVNVGIAATATSADDILSAFDLNGITEGAMQNCYVPEIVAETEVTVPADWGAAQYITFTGASTTAGFTGKLFVEYIRQAS